MDLPIRAKALTVLIILTLFFCFAYSGPTVGNVEAARDRHDIKCYLIGQGNTICYTLKGDKLGYISLDQAVKLNLPIIN